ncbi:hypothetical protein V6N13_000125 [Hibiscus sabdariffa]
MSSSMKKNSPALSNAIAASNISIIVLSEDYASSKSCLAELSDIMDHKTSFEKHETEGLRQVEQWKKTFAAVGKLTGWHIKSNRPETEYIKEIVDVVAKKLRNNLCRPSACDELVGIDDQKNKILGLIEQEESLVIGLWGPGGIGKTTLAEAVFHEISSNFEDRYFLQNVREKIEKQEKESLPFQTIKRKRYLFGHPFNRIFLSREAEQ